MEPKLVVPEGVELKEEGYLLDAVGLLVDVVVEPLCPVLEGSEPSFYPVSLSKGLMLPL